MLEPATTIWGEEISRGNLIQRVSSAFLLPWNTKERSMNAVDKEILNLSNVLVGEDSKLLYPSVLNKKEVSFNGDTYQMDDKAWASYKKVVGQTSKMELNKLINSDEYKNMSNTEKAKAFQDVYTNAKDEGKVSALVSMGKDEWEIRLSFFDSKGATDKNRVAAIKKSGMSAKQYYDF